MKAQLAVQQQQQQQHSPGLSPGLSPLLQATPQIGSTRTASRLQVSRLTDMSFPCLQPTGVMLACSAVPCLCPACLPGTKL